jgi:protein O-GlcNAc transferase
VTDRCARRALVLVLVLAGCGSAQKTGPAAIVPAVLPAAKPEARPHFEEGLRHLASGPRGYEAARTSFEKAIDIDPKLFEAWHDLGVVESKLGGWEAAVVALERALKLQPASRKTALALGDALTSAGRADEAVPVYERRLAAEPDDVDLRLLYVQALRESGKTQKALDEVEKLLARDSRNARGFNALGLIYYRVEKHALAESALRRATELAPNDADAWTNLGLVAHARGRDREAFEAWNKAAGLDGDSAAPALNKAAVLLDCGDYKRARAELEKASKARPDDPEVLVALGVAHRGMKDHERAKQAYERALELRADYAPALFNLGVLYMDFLPDKKKARQHLILYRKVAPSRDPRLKEAEARLKELR